MCKIIIDAFDTQESAIAFVDWFKKNIQNSTPHLFTTDGVRTFYWDGVDTVSSNKDVVVINIVEDYYDNDSDDD